MKNRILNANPLRFSLLLLCLLLSTTLSAQTNSGFISGKVYEIIQGKHEPSIGVNVSIENDQRRVLTGVTTDVNGAFSLRVPSGAATLVFSFIEREDGENKELLRFYVTDDANHIPVRLDMFLSFGSAKAFLRGYKGVKNPVTSKLN